MSSAPPEVEYPCSDGEPMADNMRQGQWMVMLFGNLDRLLDCFVGINNFWFPVEGEPELRLAPDVYVAFGRPKGHRDSYLQWKEDDTPVTVVIEILSPKNSDEEMVAKLHFYEEYGAEEYYVYDPKRNHLEVWVRRGSLLRRQHPSHGFTSPRMGIRFDLSGEQMAVWRPDGRRFLTVAELDAEREQAERAAVLAVARAQSAEAGRERAEQAAAAAVTRAQSADAERDQAERAARAEQHAREQAEQAAAAAMARALAAEADRRDAEEQRASSLRQLATAQDTTTEAEARAAALRLSLARLRELGRRARLGVATADELAELERLEQDAS
ncbi:MAG: Uma2 family endonuclease [Gemmataceae bacterium]